MLTIAVALLVTACNSSAATTAISARPSPSPHPTAVVPQQLCFTTPPADWSAAMSKPVVTLTGVNYGVGAVDDRDGLAFGEAWTPSRSSLASINLSTGRMTTIAPMSSKGFGWMASGDGWVAWPQDGLGGSSIQLYDGITHERREISTSGPAQAVIGDGDVAWIESAGAQSVVLRVYQLTTKTTTTLDTGNLEAPVFAGKYIVWEKQGATGNAPSFVFADAGTLNPVEAPLNLAAPTQIGFLAGSPDYLMWIDGGSALYVDDLARSTVKHYISRDHYLEFPNIAGHNLTLEGPDSNSVLDVRSGSGFSLPLGGGIASAGDTIVVVNAGGDTSKSGFGTATVSVLHPSQLSPLGPCTT